MTKPTGYLVQVRRSAEKDLDRLSDALYERVAASIRSLQDLPRPPGCKRLRGRAGYRVRVGDYRIVYRVDDKNRSVDVMAIGHRADIYKKR